LTAADMPADGHHGLVAAVVCGCHPTSMVHGCWTRCLEKSILGDDDIPISQLHYCNSIAIEQTLIGPCLIPITFKFLTTSQQLVLQNITPRTSLSKPCSPVLSIYYEPWSKFAAKEDLISC